MTRDLRGLCSSPARLYPLRTNGEGTRRIITFQDMRRLIHEKNNNTEFSKILDADRGPEEDRDRDHGKNVFHRGSRVSGAAVPSIERPGSWGEGKGGYMRTLLSFWD